MGCFATFTLRGLLVTLVLNLSLYKITFSFGYILLFMGNASHSLSCGACYVLSCRVLFFYKVTYSFLLSVRASPRILILHRICGDLY